MKNIFLTVILGCFGILALACGDTATNNGNAGTKIGNAVNTVGNAANTVANTVSNATTASPEDFMAAAAQGGVAEVELGKLAVANSENADIKKFGQMMVDDHTKANNELKALMEKKKATVPADIGSHKSLKEKLEGLKGIAFDKTYVDAMVKDHEADIKAFEKQANSGTDADVKAFAAKTLPLIRKHREAIQAVIDKMNK